MSNEAPEPRRSRWDTVYLVCKDCGKRGSGPKDLKPKTVATAVRKHLGADKPRPRVLLTGCLGLCPKGAVALACVGGAGPSRIVAIGSKKQVGAVMPLLRRRED